jgi:hypothetical protein
MAELYANDFTTTLSSGCTSGATSITTAAAAPAALQGGEFRIVIGSELLLVTAGESTTTWTVTRGIEGTSAAAHIAGVAVAHVLTAAGLVTAIGTGVTISGLPAVTLPAGTDEFIINQGGTSKKVTLTQLRTAGGEFASATAKVDTSETTTSTGFADLTTPGPSVTVNVGASGKVRVTIKARVANTVAAGASYVGFGATGANTVANDVYLANSAGYYVECSTTVLLTGLTAGSTTFKMMYAVGANTGTFSRRAITVEPAP